MPKFVLGTTLVVNTDQRVRLTEIEAQHTLGVYNKTDQ